MQIYDIEEVIRKKRDVRKFKPDQIPDDIVTKILEAGRLSQSSKNSQPWYFIVIKNKETLNTLATYTYSGDFLKDAPLAIAIVLHNAKLESDGGRCIQNMMLTAWKYNIGSCWISNFWEKSKELLEVPMSPDYKLLTVIPFGFIPDNLSKPGKKKRKSLAEIVYTEKFGNPFHS